jgi:chemotaxis protein methyltransferase CheR
MTRKPLNDAEFRLFSEWLVEEFGLQFGPERRDILRARLDPRRAELGFETFEQLYFHLKYHPEREEERLKLIPHLTNNESYFFREPNQLDVLRADVLARVKARLEARNRQEVRILSAGCASGEEPYTLAMTTEMSGLFPPPWNVRVTGVDLDHQALDRARSARYGENAFRRVEERLRSEFFTRDEDGQWLVAEPVRSRVQFATANLAEDSWVRRQPRQDVIFCRNVLIYFSDEAIRVAADSFFKALEPGGYLFLGHAETLSRVPTRFETVRMPGAIFYHKPEGSSD